MRATLIGLFVLGVIAALSAAVLLAFLRTQDEPETVVVVEPEEREAAEKIVVASRDLVEMMPVRADDVAVREVPPDEVPAGALRSPQSVIGKVLATSMMEEQPFTRASFVREGTGVHMATSLADGKRAMSIELSGHSRLEGMLYPGSMVDVIASFRAPTSEDETAGRGNVLSTVLLEAVQVLAIDDWSVVSGDDQENAERGSARRRIVTLLVDSKQAEALQLASAHGTISLTLRNPLDRSPTRERGTRMVDLSPFFAEPLVALGDMSPTPEDVPAEPEPKKVESPQWRVSIIRGTSSQDTKAFRLDSVQPK